jgi:hypothetical protein
MHYLLSFVIVYKNDTASFSETSNFKNARGTKGTKRTKRNTRITRTNCNQHNKSNAFRHAVQVAHGVFAPGPTVCH